MHDSRQQYDAIVIGSGPNGLAAAITIAQAGRSVLVLEGQDSIGGGTRSIELTRKGFLHDICSAVHPMGVSSPFFRSLPLASHGLEWIEPTIAMAHPLDDGSAVALDHSIEKTAQNLRPDAERYTRLMNKLVADWPRVEPFALGITRFPAHPIAAAHFGALTLRSASGLARSQFQAAPARALFAGLAGHSIVPLEYAASAAIGLVIGMAAHRTGWPFVRGGSGRLAEALAAYLESLGGEIVTGTPVSSLDELPPARIILCDVTPRQLVSIAGARLPAAFRHQLERFRYGPGACKVDWALDAPIPWKAEACRHAGTIHLGGTLEEIAASERACWANQTSERPFVILTQPTLFDPSRAPEGKHIAWAYCHVPHGSRVDMTLHIEAQVERFAPGFRDRILARHTIVAAEMAHHNPNLVGGDIGGGAVDLRQMFLRPTRRLYRTPVRNLYLCSSSTPPGPGVHGMCGHLAARAALRDNS